MAQGQRGRVLLVDDSESILVTLAAILEGEFDVRVARSADEAMTIIKRTPIDVVVTDQNMGARSGTDLLGQVEEQFPEITGILLTGRPDSVRVHTLVEKSIKRGNVLVLYKPVDPGLVTSWIRNGVAMAGLARMKKKEWKTNG